MANITRKDAETAFERLCKRLKKRVATAYNDVGAWQLDYIKDYGGMRIVEISNSTGGEKTVMGAQRRKPKEFVDCVCTLIDAIDSGLVVVPETPKDETTEVCDECGEKIPLDSGSHFNKHHKTSCSLHSENEV